MFFSSDYKARRIGRQFKKHFKNIHAGLFGADGAMPFPEDVPEPIQGHHHSVITCGILIANMVSVDFRLTEILSYVNVFHNRYHWSGGNQRPPIGGLHYVRAACGGAAPFVTGTAMNCISRAQGDAAHLAPVRCRNMKKLILIVFVLAAAYFVATESGLVTAQRTGVVDTISGGDQILTSAFANHRSNVQVQDGGIVTRVLADDNDGSRHQRFIIQLGSGQTLLIAHNIDLAGRIDSLKEGDRVAFNGEYEWNPQGGVIHWTHHDPAGRHLSGWVQHNGRKYQ